MIYLIVVDVIHVWSMIHHRLDREGYQVDAVQGGDKAVRTIKKRTPDLLITDLLIPEKEGLELI